MSSLEPRQGPGSPLSADAAACAARLDGSGAHWRLSTNHDGTPVFSCRQAAKFRDRLGSGANGGIPLWDELKTLVGIVTDPRGEYLLAFAAHTRANTVFDDRSLLQALGVDAKDACLRSLIHDDVVYDDDPSSRAAMARKRWFGRVNPFNVDAVLSDLADRTIRIDDVVQVWDVSLALDGGTPDTVMTNAGDRTLALEIAPAALIDAVSRLSLRSEIAPIARPCPIWLGRDGRHRRDYFLQCPPPRGPKIGILTGNAPEAGLVLWQDMLVAIRTMYAHVPDVVMPDLLVHSLPTMGLSMELSAREVDVRLVVTTGMRGLLEAGCTLVTVACNTTIYFEPEIAELCEQYGARFVSIAEACMPAVRQAIHASGGTGAVGLLGIGPVVDVDGAFSGYGRHLAAEGVEVTPCPADQLAFAVKSQGAAEDPMKAFRQMIRGLPDSIAVVILAVTEASAVYRAHVAKAPRGRQERRTYVDPLAELGRYLVYLYVAAGYRDCAVCQIPSDFDIRNKLQHKLGWMHGTQAAW